MTELNTGDTTRKPAAPAVHVPAKSTIAGPSHTETAEVSRSGGGAGARGDRGASAARAAMVARLEEAGDLAVGPVREALLSLPREVLMPQAYVRRSAPDEKPLRWDLLDWARPGDREELLRVLHSGDSVSVQHAGEPLLGRAAAFSVRGFHDGDVEHDGHDRGPVGRAGPAKGAAGSGCRDRRGGHRGCDVFRLRGRRGRHARRRPQRRRGRASTAGRARVPARRGERGRSGRAGRAGRSSTGS